MAIKLKNLGDELKTRTGNDLQIYGSCMYVYVKYECKLYLRLD